MSNDTQPVNHEPTDDDFNDLSLFTGVQGAAEEYTEKAAESSGDRAPISYLDEGTYSLRIYPEVIPDEGGTRRMHTVRPFWSYTGIKGVRRLPAPKDENCPIRKEMKKLADADHLKDEAWKYRAKEEGLLKVMIFKMSHKTHKYLKLNEPMFIVLKRPGLIAWNAFLADMDPADMKDVLNPRKVAQTINVKVTKKQGSVPAGVSFGFDVKKEELPPLPDGFPSMFNVLLDEKKVATEDELKAVRSFVSRMLVTGSRVVNPGEDSDGGAPNRSSAERSQNAKSAVAEALKAAKGTAEPPPPQDTAAPGKPVQTPVTAAGKCPSSDPTLGWGKQNGSAADCIVCEHESACSEAKLGDVPY
jgi:hypothetical protein